MNDSVMEYVDDLREHGEEMLHRKKIRQERQET